MMHKDCEIMMMEQRSDAWFEAHRGVPSASKFSNIVTSKYKKSAQWGAYLDKCVNKMLHGYTDDDYQSEWMEHGNIMEPFARQAYEEELDIKVAQVGFIKRNGVGCSPDGIRSDHIGLEIKCPSPEIQIRRHRMDVLPSDYFAQIQGSMWITGLDVWDFYSYPSTDEMKSFYIRVNKDTAYHSALDKYIPMFLEQMHKLYKKVKA